MKLSSLKTYWLLAALFLLDGSLSAAASEWRAIELASRPINIVEDNGVFWACGAEELIANSTDGGKTWSVQHFVKGGGILLNVGFANEHFGYAAGTSGALVFTYDGGKTWVRMRAPEQVIYQVSFSDDKHGLMHTPRTIYATSDGGATWAPVKIDLGSDDFKKFSHVSTILALDLKHMAIVLSGGNAAYYRQILLITKDGGLSWKVVDIPSSGLTQLTKHGGEYWFAGMEVIEKDKPGGGYGVPLLMHSADGEDWTHLPRWSQKEFSVCNVQGCLYWDGAGVEFPPASPVNYWTFAAEKEVTAKWAVAKGAICSVAVNLRCAAVNTTQTMPPYTESSSPIKHPLFPPALDAPPSQGVQCISCDIEKVIVTQDYKGVAEVELKLHITQNGLTQDVEVVHATTPEIGERMAATARSWIFVPYEKDGVVHPTVTSVKLRVQAIKSK
jgi:photosystem II stability/assembly factor-like uncharacterized protein